MNGIPIKQYRPLIFKDGEEAKGGQIIISDATRETLNNVYRSKSSHFDNIRLKGGKQHSAIYLLQWEEDSNESSSTMFMSALSSQDLANDSPPQRLTLTYQGHQFELKATDMPFVIGRSQNANLTVDYKMASREHCTLDYSRGKFVLIDKSTNGSYLKAEDRQPIYLRREETALRQQGVISFSVEADFQPGLHLIDYLVS